MATDNDDFDHFLKVDYKTTDNIIPRAHLVLDLLHNFGMLQVGSDELSVDLYSLVKRYYFFFPALLKRFCRRH